jgi:hypothetical protein
VDAFTGNQTGWIYLTAYLYAFTVRFLNLWPQGYKGMVMGGGGNIRANAYLYKIVGQGDLKNGVVMIDTGVIGQYNRAGRSLANFLENGTPILLCFILDGIVYGYLSFIFAAIFCVGRIAH